MRNGDRDCLTVTFQTAHTRERAVYCVAVGECMSGTVAGQEAREWPPYWVKDEVCSGLYLTYTTSTVAILCICRDFNRLK